MEVTIITQTPTVKPVVQAPVQNSDMVQNQPKKGLPISSLFLIIIVAAVVLGGVATGYVLSNGSTMTSSENKNPLGAKDSPNDKMVGSLEKDVKYDEVEGKLVTGGIGSEGTHHLERPGGDSQNVYLTSSTVNLDTFVGRTVKVWGITFAAQKAGWLMDVAQLEAK